MADMLNAKELAAMVRVLFAQTPSDTKEREAWILRKCTEEVFESIGGVSPDLEEACEAELAVTSAMNTKEESAGNCVSAAAGDAGAEKSNLNRADQLNLRALAERHLHDGYSYVRDEVYGQYGYSNQRRERTHFAIFESIKSILDEPDRLYLDEQVKQCRADVERFRKKLSVSENLREPLNDFLQAEAGDLPVGEGRAAADDLKALLAKHGTDAIVETLSTAFVEVAKKKVNEQLLDDDIPF